eukprot:1772834-Amphidinium_carterae.1
MSRPQQNPESLTTVFSRKATKLSLIGIPTYINMHKVGFNGKCGSSVLHKDTATSLGEADVDSLLSDHQHEA